MTAPARDLRLEREADRVCNAVLTNIVLTPGVYVLDVVRSTESNNTSCAA